MKAPGDSFKISRHFVFHFCIFLLRITCVYSLLFKIIFQDSRKEINHFKKITVSRQVSIREIGNFGTDQLRDTGRIQ